MPVSAPGRVSVATNDCFGDPQSASGRSEHQAALEKLYLPVWVGSTSSQAAGADVQPLRGGRLVVRPDQFGVNLLATQ
jgi:hypothetical protein